MCLRSFFLSESPRAAALHVSVWPQDDAEAAEVPSRKPFGMQRLQHFAALLLVATVSRRHLRRRPKQHPVGERTCEGLDRLDLVHRSSTSPSGIPRNISDHNSSHAAVAGTLRGQRQAQITERPKRREREFARAGKTPSRIRHGLCRPNRMLLDCPCEAQHRLFTE